MDGWNPAAVKHILTFTDTSNHGTWAQVSSPELNIVKSTDLYSLTVRCVGEQHSALPLFTGSEAVIARTGQRMTGGQPGILWVTYEVSESS